MNQAQSTREAWNLAMQGILNNGFGNISSSEINDIIKYPPIINFEHYQKIKQLGKGIWKEEPELKKIKPDITREEVFFYLTRGYLPDIPNVREYVDRIYQLNHFIDPLIKSFLIKLYGSERNYATRETPLPLENALISYNQVMGIPGLIEAIAEVNNINIFGYDDADIGFITEIEKRLEI